jgi:hypothetical protein
MSDAPSKFLHFLDQLLPFLAVCPPWLKIWVHVLILLNFITIAGVAVYYLSAKEHSLEESSLKHFSIDLPTTNQEVPLGNTATMLVSGALPKAKGADVALEILKLPERQSIPQTAPQKTTSTFDGHWWFEAAKFAGFGSYEIKVTASLEGETRVASVMVTCYDKATAYKLSIEREKKFRPGASIIDLPQGIAPLEQVTTKFQEKQDEFISVYFKTSPLNDDDLQKSLSIINQSLDLLDSALPLFPNNFDLQTGRAFFLKNYFMVARDLHRPDEARQALAEAQLMFEAVREQNPGDTNAWNGLGSVFLLSGQPEKGLWYINKSLELAPDNPYARIDQETALAAIEQQKAGK